MSDVSNEMLTTVILDMDRRFSQRLQNMESFMLAIGKQVEEITKKLDALHDSETKTEAARRHTQIVDKIAAISETKEDTQATIGRLLSAVMNAKNTIADLSEVEFDITSTGGEDGIIDWLAGHVALSTRRFVEVGAGDFKHGICRFLAAQRNWKGLLLDPDGVALYHARQDDFYRRHNLNAFEGAVTRESIDQLIEVNEMGGPLGLLSLNAGGSEYWVWDGLDISQPDILVCAFNPVLGDRYAITVPYNPNFAPLEMHASNYYRGASIMALQSLAAAKNYRFLGTNSKGTSAFFVRAALAESVLQKIGTIRAFPARARNVADKHEELEAVGGISRLNLIKDLPVVDLDTGRTVKLSELERPYSDQWQLAMR